MTALQRLLTILGVAIGYDLLFRLNVSLFENLEYSDGVHWIFLPSGLRLFFVLVFGLNGAFGIALSSLIINYTFGSQSEHLFNVVTALISGMSPYLARCVALNRFELSENLEGLNSKLLFKLSVIFALMSALIHQLWFFWNDKSDNIITGTAVMALGDWLGTVLILATANWLMKAFRLIRFKSEE